MENVRRRLRAVAWVALAAMWALALLPTLAHARAFGAGSGTHWVEVCTPQGVRWVASADADASAAPLAPVSAAGHLEHCPWCQPAQADHALPSAAAELRAFSPAAGGAPVAYHSGPPPSAPPWHPGLARAPPPHG